MTQIRAIGSPNDALKPLRLNQLWLVEGQCELALVNWPMRLTEQKMFPRKRMA